MFCIRGIKAKAHTHRSAVAILLLESPVGVKIGRDSSVSIETALRYVLNDRDSISGRGKDFFSIRHLIK
jgi:hypothetical protein